MKMIDVNSFIKSLDVRIPPKEEFFKFADGLGCLHLNLAGQVERLIYVRGLLLYALVTKYKPKTILEFGTAHGYSSLCMAWAMTDSDISGTIYTVDRFPQDKPLRRIIGTGTGKYNIISQSNKEYWPQIAPATWINKIKPLTGHTGQVMKKIKLPKIEFSYIDAAHNYEAVKHDFYSFIDVSADEFGILFDDYIDRPLYGVTRLVDEEIKNNFDMNLIETDLINIDESKNKHGMVWVHSGTAKRPIKELFPHDEISKYLNNYRRYESLVTIPRHRINETIPALQKIRFKFWKK